MPDLFLRLEANQEVQAGLWDAFRRVVLTGTLPRGVKEMMGELVARRRGSAVPVRVSAQTLLGPELEEPILRAIQSDRIPAGLPPKTAALLKFSCGSSHGPEGAMRLREAGLSERELLEAVATVSLYEMLCSFGELLREPGS